MGTWVFAMDIRGIRRSRLRRLAGATIAKFRCLHGRMLRAPIPGRVSQEGQLALLILDNATH